MADFIQEGLLQWDFCIKGERSDSPPTPTRTSGIYSQRGGGRGGWSQWIANY